MKFLSKFTFYLLLVIVFVSCSKNDKTRQQILRLNIYTEPPTLDPREARDLASVNILKMLYEGLFRENLNGEIEPALVREYEVSPDGLTYVFHLKEAFWSNGDEILAEDFVEAWRWKLLPNSPSKSADLMYVIKNAKEVKEGCVNPEKLGIEVLDRKSFKVTLDKPVAYFKNLLLFPSYFPVNRKIAELNKDWARNSSTYLSNGPFVMNEWKHHHKMIFAKNEHYWDASKVKLIEIHLSMIDNTTTELSLYEKGELDWAGTPLSPGLPFDAIPTLMQSNEVEITPWAAPYYYVFNTKRPPFDHVKMRKAFTYAINRREIIDHVTQGNEIISLNYFPPVYAALARSELIDGDVIQARKLFQEALNEMGVEKDQLPPIQLVYNTNEGHHKIAQAIQQQWQEAFDIHVTLENKEWKVFLEDVLNRNFSVTRWGLQPSYADPVAFLEVIKNEKDPINTSGWYNTEFDRLVSESYFLPEEQRKEYLTRAEEIALNEMPLCPLYFRTDIHLKNPKLRDVHTSPIGGFLDFKHAHFHE